MKQVTITDQDLEDFKTLQDMVLGDYAGFCLDNKDIAEPSDQEQMDQTVLRMVRVLYRIGRELGTDPFKSDTDGLIYYFKQKGQTI